MHTFQDINVELKIDPAPKPGNTYEARCDRCDDNQVKISTADSIESKGQK